MRKRLLQLGLVAIGLTVALLHAPAAHALSGSDFNPGRIIDDSVFFNKDAMSVGDIQNFLQSQVPSCDTNHPTAYSAYQPPWTCLYQYYENPSNQANNIGSAGNIPAGAISAAQIIYNAAQAYSISPKALIVLIQKESSLITDSWPYPSQYRSATGYGCPDTSVCDSQYYGFYNQVMNAAHQFRRYATYPDQYNYAAGRNNNIGYNPNGACGYQTVYIQNQATAGLYNYTPYVPNAAALNNLYGTGDSCSAYGNRNFWRIYNDWFGNPTTPPYAWSVVDQQVQKYVTGEGLDPSAGITAGERVVFYVRAKNTGTATWTNSGPNPTRIGTSNPYSRTSLFCEVSWIACWRPVTMAETSVAPGETGTFQFAVQAPLTPGNYTEYYNLLSEGVTWMQDIGLYFTIKVIPTTLSSSLVSSTLPSTITAGQTASGVVTIKNTGNVTWYNVPNYPLRLATASPDDRSSSFYDSSWYAKTRVANQNEFRVPPQQNATFNFTVKAPTMNGSYTENFAPLLEGYMWGSQSVPLNFTVVGGTNPPSDTLSSGQSLGPGQYIASGSGGYKLYMQGDGNVVLYSPTRAIWWTSTDGKAANKLVMQGDGNLVLYDAQYHALWNTGTQGNSGLHLILQGDGNLVLYDAQYHALWNTGTQGQ